MLKKTYYKNVKHKKGIFLNNMDPPFIIFGKQYFPLDCN